MSGCAQPLVGFIKIGAVGLLRLKDLLGPVTRVKKKKKKVPGLTRRLERGRRTACRIFL